MVHAWLPPILALFSYPECPGQTVNREVEIKAEANHAMESETVFDVPSGKRLTLDHVSILVTLRFPSIVFGFVTVEGAEARPAIHRFPLESIGQSKESYVYLSSERLRLHVPAGGRLKLGFFRYSPGSTGTAEATISGCLVEEPSGSESSGQGSSVMRFP